MLKFSSSLTSLRSTKAGSAFADVAGAVLHDRVAYGVFFILASLTMVAVGYSAINLSAVVSYTRDIWHHLSVYRELIASPLDAMNPHVATDDPSRSYSPWTLFVAVLARVAGLDAFGAIAISAILSALTILIGLYLFSRRYMQSAWGPAVMILVFFGTWVQYVNHTGFHSPATVMYSISYPFAIVLGAGFLSWWMTLRALDAPQKQLVVLLVLLSFISAAMFITHQLQGLFGICASIGFALFAGDATLRRRVVLSLALLSGLWLSQFWWYFDPVEYVLKSEVQSGHTAARHFTYSIGDYRRILLTVGLALAGVVGLVDFQNRRLRLELALPVLTIVAGFILLLLRESWVSVRIPPFIIVLLQIALATYLVSPLLHLFGGLGRLVDLAVRATLFCFLIIGFDNSWSKGLYEYRRAQTYLETGEIKKLPDTWNDKIVQAAQIGESLVEEGSTVITHHDVAFPIEATSLAVVAIPRLFVEVPDMLQRQEDTVAFFAADTPTTIRCEILQRYDVQMIAYRPFWLDEAVQQQLKVFGAVTEAYDLSFIPATDGRFEACPS